MRPPRLVDIAAHAKVSEATVSRVLNNKPNVAEATRQSVLTALDVLGYERPLQLRRKTAGLVGLIVPELDNPIFPVLAQIIETALAVHGYTPVLCTQTPGGMHEDDYTEMLLDRGVAGMIVVSGQHADTVRLRDRSQPPPRGPRRRRGRAGRVAPQPRRPRDGHGVRHERARRCLGGVGRRGPRRRGPGG